MNDIQVINNGLATTEDSGSELKKVVNQKLKEKGLGDINTFLTDLLIDVALNAESPDIKGNMHRDYGEINRAINTLHKIANPKIGQTNVNVGFFTPPNNINY